LPLSAARLIVSIQVSFILDLGRIAKQCREFGGCLLIAPRLTPLKTAPGRQKIAKISTVTLSRRVSQIVLTSGSLMWVKVSTHQAAMQHLKAMLASRVTG
jgi:hypothetical protein